MAFPIIKSAFSAGELSPSLYGRLDLNKWHQGLSVCRNFVVNYKGGIFSRAGTALVGICKQAASASSYPPRNIEFSFNIFQSYILEFGDQYMRVIANGGYVTETNKIITNVTQANPGVVTSAGHGFSNGDWVFVDNVLGMTQLNGRTFIVAAAAANTFQLNDVFGVPVDASFYGLYTSGGTVARLVTVTTPYAAVDLPYLKFVQSADVMSLCCVNQETQTDYPPQELTRLAANSWTIGPPTFASSIAAPGSCTVTGTAYATGPGPAAYGYVVTAVDAVTGDESVASPIGSVTNVVDIAGQFGTNKVTFPAVTGAAKYNVYRAAPDYTNTGNFIGQLFGYVGSTNTTSWLDANIIADFATTPPQHINPFPSSGNYPGDVAYFQQRRAYAYTINLPDTYEMSQPGSYTNFDSADPPIDSDSIIGSPWASQVNGIQWMMPMPGGLVIGTGKDAWQLSGTTGPGSPVTPAQQNAQAQESIGFSPTLPPIKISASILYGQALGSIVREFNYNFYFNIYAGKDITVLSNQMFDGFLLKQWGWAQEPYKVIWAVRDDGKMLALTYVKDEEVCGWTRHDSNGLAVSVSVASEPPANAVYWIFKRYIPGKGVWAYMQERMDNRLWRNVEQAWCVDSALALGQPAPAATLTASRAAPTLGCIAGPIIMGGSGYSATPSGRIQDPTGTGAVVNSVTVVAGEITAYTISPEGSGYTDPVVIFTDATGSGALAQILVDNAVTFDASAAVFASTDVGSVIRMGGGIATITAFVSTQEVTANFLNPITATVTDDPNNLPIPALAGQWTMTAPIATVSNLDHLEGMIVTGLADGKVILLSEVVNGMINLPAPASAVVVGLPFIAQAQSMHADIQGQMIQGKRKRIQGVTVRLANSRGVKVGQDQPIAAALPNQEEMPWDVAPNLMTETVDTLTNAINAGAAVPLFTGDKYVAIAGDYSTVDGQPSPGMVAILQQYPLPCEITAMMPEMEMGDVPDA